VIKAAVALTRREQETGMAWERRKHSKTLYYARTERAGKKRRRIYFGTGPIAELAATLDLLRQVDVELVRRDSVEKQMSR
jgi:hypothetical protein